MFIAPSQQRYKKRSGSKGTDAVPQCVQGLRHSPAAVADSSDITAIALL